MKKFDISTSELCITGKPPEDFGIIDKLWMYHIIPMQRVRDKLQVGIWASQKSGYRPLEWEIKHGRSGNSQHTFKGKGAVDWTCNQESIRSLIDEIKRLTEYTRIAYYPANNFIHCDYKETPDNKRQFFHSTPSSNWTLIESF